MSFVVREYEKGILRQKIESSLHHQGLLNESLKIL